MTNRISQGFTGAIASAVAGEVTRLAAHPEFHQSEGVAYKAAWDRLGDAAKAPHSPALNLCAAFRRDCVVSECAARLSPSWARFVLRSVELAA